MQVFNTSAFHKWQRNGCIPQKQVENRKPQEKSVQLFLFLFSCLTFLCPLVARKCLHIVLSWCDQFFYLSVALSAGVLLLQFLKVWCVTVRSPPPQPPTPVCELVMALTTGLLVCCSCSSSMAICYFSSPHVPGSFWWGRRVWGVFLQFRDDLLLSSPSVPDLVENIVQQSCMELLQLSLWVCFTSNPWWVIVTFPLPRFQSWLRTLSNGIMHRAATSLCRCVAPSDPWQVISYLSSP